MRDQDRQLAGMCQSWSKAALSAEKWLQDNRKLVGAECDMLRKDMRSAARSFRKLSRAASRKMCVGVFGPSQAGKSYLISALARDRKGELRADFCGKAVDFIREINPEGGKESTGLVTRFTTTPPEGISERHPIRLRLFSEMDLVKVFANTYYSDCDHKEIPDQEAVIKLLRELEQKAGPAGGEITSDDVEDLKEYLQKNFASRPRVQLLSRVYWVKAMELAPRLALADRCRLFGCIWDNTPEFDQFHLRLATALSTLGFAAEANCPLDALLPREKSIIDVTLLNSAAPGASEQLEIEGVGGKTATLPRSVVTALTAELTIYMPEKPEEFFDYTDLLDFPGYRSRLKVTDLAKELGRAGSLEQFFLRGKVAYLFERYCDEQELTGMLLCIGPSNQEVQDLPAAINNWISLTQGASPEERRGHEPTLFFILTKMDMEFERKQGVEDVSNRWNTRLQSSLTNFFGVQFDWPENWDGRPFRNMYLMRNPNFRCDAIFTFSADGTETGIRPDMKDYVEEVKQSFLKSPLVLEHFENPAEAWDAAMKLNDGGIDLLRRKLAPICDPNRKYNQTLDRGTATARRIAGRLAPYYRSGDSEKLRKEKEIQAQKLLRVVASIIERQQFADLQSRLQIDDFTLYQLAEDCADQASTDESGAAAPGTVVGSSISASGLMDDLFGDAAPAPEPKATPAAPLDNVVQQGQDQAEIFCRKAIEYWFQNMRDLAANPVLPGLYAVDQSFLEKFTGEIAQAARHFRLLDSMISAIREQSAFRNVTRDAAAWRMASEATCRINSFVAWLGHDARLGQKTQIIFKGAPVELFTPPVLSFGEDGEPIVPEQPSQFDRAYYIDWMKAFFDCAVAGAADLGPDEDPVQNKMLGDILAQLDPSRI